MQVSYELKFHLLRWTKKTNFDLSSSGICSRVWRTSSCPPSLPGNIGSELESTSRTCFGEVKKVLSMTLTRRWREPTSYVIVLGSWSMKTSWAMFIPSASLKSPTYWWYYDQNVLPVNKSFPTSSEYSSTMKALGSQTSPAKLVATVSSFNTSNPSILPLSGDM